MAHLEQNRAAHLKSYQQPLCNRANLARFMSLSDLYSLFGVTLEQASAVHRPSFEKRLFNNSLMYAHNFFLH